MACYLAFIPAETECWGCARPVRRGLAGFTDEILAPELTPICEICLHSLDELLRGVLVIVRESGRVPSDAGPCARCGAVSGSGVGWSALEARSLCDACLIEVSPHWAWCSTSR